MLVDWLNKKLVPKMQLNAIKKQETGPENAAECDKEVVPVNGHEAPGR
jgi:hypothetical protein